MERRVGIPELGRMEAHLKELQAENAKLKAVVDAAEKVVDDNHLILAHYNELKELRQAIKEVEDE
jgi:hypothetical protein